MAPYLKLIGKLNHTTLKYRWLLSTVSDEHAVQKLAQTINVTPSVARILVGRGVSTFEEAKSFFRPSLEDLHDPFLMDGMELAVERTMRAVAEGEKIAVYGDYDVDGTNSAAMLYLYFTRLGADVEVYIPDRFTEGYGVSTTGIDRLVANGVRLIITIDCGITAVDQVQYARSIGIDVVICDHHEAGNAIPAAYAVLDPIKPGCNYPFKFLSGCGVGFKLIQAIAMRRGEVETVYQYLDFVAISSAADIVPLIGENRILVAHGLRKLNDAPRPGIRGLLECAAIKSGNLGTAQIVFGIAPRINAAGRLGDARRAVDMLIEDDEIKAFQMAQVLESTNRSRRTIDEETFTQALVIAEQMLADGDCRALVIHNPNWHPGVIGIVASRIVERYYLPAVLLTSVDGVAKGSARSIIGFDIHNALRQCEEHIEQFGGHKYAAGLSIQEGNIEVFRLALNEFAHDKIDDEMLTPQLTIDAEVKLAELDQKFFHVVKQFAPFGPGNTRPHFLTPNVEIIGYPKVVGKDHLKFRVRTDTGFIEAIAFGMGSRMGELTGLDRFDIVYNIEENNFRGAVTPQLRILDFRTSADDIARKEKRESAVAEAIAAAAVAAAAGSNGTSSVPLNGTTSH